MVSVATEPAGVSWRASTKLQLAVFGTWSFLASMLLFWVELMVAKMLLPSFGGSASVWNTSLVFFQVSLLAGYAFAHVLSRLDSRWHKSVELLLVVVPALTLPIALPAFLESPAGSPAFAVLIALTVMVGAPFFALATASPTLQTWFARSSHRRAADPYFLYALSNVGSLVGLVGYPVVVERLLPLHTQTGIWTAGYVLFAVLAVIGSKLSGSWEASVERSAKHTEPKLGRRAKWAAIAFVPSLGLMGVTRHLSTDVAAFPLLWMLPLALYLASFTLTFQEGGEKWVRLGDRALRLLIIPAVLLLAGTSSSLWLTFSVPLLLLAALSLAGHGEVYRDRPAAGSLTHFYLWVSIGGAAGGLFAALIAPTVFDFVIEYPLALALAALMTGRRLRLSAPPAWMTTALVVVALVAGVVIPSLTGRVLLWGLAGVIAVLWMDHRWLAAVVAVVMVAVPLTGSPNVIASDRTFFGVYRVNATDQERTLVSGTTFHGTQVFADGRGQLDPVSYYHPDGPVGDIFGALRGSGDLNVGVVGLGIGGLVGYGSSGDEFTFYEIDPLVEEIARDASLFTFLSETSAAVDVVIGDGRLELERRDPRYDLLIVDAFTSDSIPVHLLTVEAMATYLGSLSGDGRLLIHISNRHLDLEPIVGRIASEMGVTARVNRYTPGEGVERSAPSVWALVESGVDPLDLPSSWGQARNDAGLWSDDYSNILSVIDWQ